MLAERKLQKVKVSIMRKPQFAAWHGLMMVGKTAISDDIPTACTDGRDEWYGRAFVDKLDDRELTFVVLHETLHKAFRHLTTWRKLAEQDQYLTNAACDYVINLMLHDMDKTEQAMRFPRKPDGTRMGLLDERFRGMNAKQVYDILKKEQDENGGGGGGEGFDDHDWDGAKEMTPEEQKQLAREVDQALRQGRMMSTKYGNKPGDADLALGDLLSPKIDWRVVLREFVTSVCSAKDASSWRRVNRRYLSSGVYMPTLIGERVGRIVVGVDTSGSIGGREITRFLSEVKSIAEDVHPEKLDLLYWDTRVAGHEEYEETTLDTLTQSTQPKGGGGTDVREVFKYINERSDLVPEVCIMLTDGYTPYPDSPPPYPVMWVMTTKQLAPFGTNVELTDD